MKVLFAGAEVVFIFCSSLVNGSCVRKKADNPAETTCVPKNHWCHQDLCTPVVSGAYSSPVNMLPSACFTLVRFSRKMNGTELSKFSLWQYASSSTSHLKGQQHLAAEALGFRKPSLRWKQ